MIKTIGDALNGIAKFLSGVSKAETTDATTKSGRSSLRKQAKSQPINYTKQASNSRNIDNAVKRAAKSAKSMPINALPAENGEVISTAKPTGNDAQINQLASKVNDFIENNANLTPIEPLKSHDGEVDAPEASGLQPGDIAAKLADRGYDQSKVDAGIEMMREANGASDEKPDWYTNTLSGNKDSSDAGKVIDKSSIGTVTGLLGALNMADYDGDGKVSAWERADNGYDNRDNVNSQWITVDQLQRYMENGLKADGLEDYISTIRTANKPDRKDYGSFNDKKKFEWASPEARESYQKAMRAYDELVNQEGLQVLNKHDLENKFGISFPAYDRTIEEDPIGYNVNNIINGATNVANTAEGFWNAVNNLRTDNVDYHVNVDGSTYSGKEFKEALDDYFGNLNSGGMDDSEYYQYTFADGSKSTDTKGTDLEMANYATNDLDQITQIIYKVNGKEKALTLPEDLRMTEDEYFDLSEAKRDKVLNEWHKALVSITPIPFTFDDKSIEYGDIPNYTKDKGHLANYVPSDTDPEKVEEVRDELFKNAGQYVDYSAGPFGILKYGAAPKDMYSELAQETIMENPEMFFEAQLPDGALSSAAYFLPKMAGTISRGASQYLLNQQGIDSMSGRTKDGVYSSVDDAATAPLWTAAASTGEALLGGAVGGAGAGKGIFDELLNGAEKAFTPTRNLISKYPNLMDWVNGTISEGIEEIATAIPWDAVGKPIEEMFTNSLKNETGYSTGEADMDTSLPDRALNAANQAWSDFIIGSAIGGIASAPQTIINKVTTPKDPTGYLNAIRQQEIEQAKRAEKYNRQNAS